MVQAHACIWACVEARTCPMHEVVDDASKTQGKAQHARCSTEAWGCSSFSVSRRHRLYIHIYICMYVCVHPPYKPRHGWTRLTCVLSFFFLLRPLFRFFVRFFICVADCFRFFLLSQFPCSPFRDSASARPRFYEPHMRHIHLSILLRCFIEVLVLCLSSPSFSPTTHRHTHTHGLFF